MWFGGIPVLPLEESYVWLESQHFFSTGYKNSERFALESSLPCLVQKLVGGLEYLDYFPFHINGMSSFPLTKCIIFQDGTLSGKLT